MCGGISPQSRFFPQNLKGENDLIHDLIFYCTNNKLCAIIDCQCLEYLAYITLNS